MDYTPMSNDELLVAQYRTIAKYIEVTSMLKQLMDAIEESPLEDQCEESLIPHSLVDESILTCVERRIPIPESILNIPHIEERVEDMNTASKLLYRVQQVRAQMRGDSPVIND